MIKITKLLLCILLLSALPFGRAQQTVTQEQCQQADAQLNQVYQQLRGTLNDVQKQQLKQAQRDWIKKRDAFVAANPGNPQGALYQATMQRVESLRAEMGKTVQGVQMTQSNGDKSSSSEPVSIALQQPHIFSTKEELKNLKVLFLNNKTLVTILPGRDIGTSEIKIWEIQKDKCLRTIELDNDFNWIFPSSSDGKFIVIAPESKIRGAQYIEIDTTDGKTREVITKNGITPYFQHLGPIQGMWHDTTWNLGHPVEKIEDALDLKANGLSLFAASPEKGLSMNIQITWDILRQVLGTKAINADNFDGVYIAQSGTAILSFNHGTSGIVYSDQGGKASIQNLDQKKLSVLLEKIKIKPRFYSVRENDGYRWTYLITEEPTDELKVIVNGDSELNILVNKQWSISIGKKKTFKNLPAQLSLNQKAEKILVSTRGFLTGINLKDGSKKFSFNAPAGTSISNPLLSKNGEKAYFGLINYFDIAPGQLIKNSQGQVKLRKEDLEKYDTRSFQGVNLGLINILTWNSGVGPKPLLTNSVLQGTHYDRKLGVFSSDQSLSLVDLDSGLITSNTCNPFERYHGDLSLNDGNFQTTYYKGSFYILRHEQSENGETDWLGLYQVSSNSPQCNLIKKINNSHQENPVIVNGERKYLSDTNEFRFDGTSSIFDFDVSESGDALAPINSKYGGSGVKFSLNNNNRSIISGGCRANWIDAHSYYLAKRDKVDIFSDSDIKLGSWPDAVHPDNNTYKWEGTDPWAFDSFSRTFAYASKEGFVSLLKMEGNVPREYIKFFLSEDGSPIFITRENFYASHAPKVSTIAFTQGVHSYPFEQFDLRLNRPDIVLDRLGAPKEAIEVAKTLREKRLKKMNVTEEMLKPDFHLPEVALTSEIPSTTSADQLDLQIKATDDKYPLDRLRVYVNNVPVNGRDGELLRDQKTQSLDKTIPIKLADGRNKIQVSVLNSAGAESLYANAEVNCTVERPKPKLYAVALGVSQYDRPEWCLKYAAKDATDLIGKLKAKSGSSYSEVKPLLLTDKEVTKESTAKIKEFLSGATIDDTVLIFMAGHGILDDKYDYYFGTTDIDPAKPSERGMAYDAIDTILAEVPSLKKALLMDTCHAGELDDDEKKELAASDGSATPAAIPAADTSTNSSPMAGNVAMRAIGTRGMTVKAVEGAKGKSDWYEKLQDMFVDLRRGSGATVISSSQGAEYAFESSEQSNGLFTYSLMEALDGKPTPNKDGQITISSIGEYVKKRVQDLTKGKQNPNLRGVNLEEDFTLSSAK